MKVSRCICEGYSSIDNEKYSTMCEIIEECNNIDIAPPVEAVEYIERVNEGSEKSAVQLRPGIDKGVTYKEYTDGKAILINLDEIKEDINMIRIFHEEFEE
jgi:hypothetical protein